MSALRDLVTGSDACAPSGAAGTNAVGALVNNLLGGASKVQEQLREVSGGQFSQPSIAPCASATLLCGA